jgi:hypothetical protein
VWFVPSLKWKTVVMESVFRHTRATADPGIKELALADGAIMGHLGCGHADPDFRRRAGREGP